MTGGLIPTNGLARTEDLALDDAAGDHAAAHPGAGASPDFSAMYARYRTDVYRLCSKLIRDKHRAEDLTQDTFVRALRSFASFDSGRGTWPWLSTIARNLCYDDLRSPGSRAAVTDRQSAFDQAFPVDATWDEVLARDEQGRIGRHLSGALKSLTPRERRIVLRKAVQEMSWAQIARLEGSTQDSVRNLAFRARKALKPLVAEARRELEALGLVPIWFRIKARIGKLRGQMTGRSWDLGTLLAEPMAGIVIGCLAITVAWASPDALQPSASRQVLRGTGTTDMSVSPPAFGPRRSSFTSSSDPHRASTITASAIHTSVTTTPRRDHHVAPPSGVIVVEVRAPGSGVVVYRTEKRFRCDGQGDDLLPEHGPIRFVC